MKVSVLTWCPWEAGHVIKVKKTPLFEHKTKKNKEDKSIVKWNISKYHEAFISRSKFTETLKSLIYMIT